METYKGLDIYRLYSEDGLEKFVEIIDSNGFNILKKENLTNNSIKMLAEFKFKKRRFYVEYLAITNKEIEEIINNNQSLVLVGRYIDGFNIKKMSLKDNYLIKSLDATLSYFDNGACFDSARFDDNNKHFTFTQFGDGILDFSFVEFGYGDIYFTRSKSNGSVKFKNVTFKNDIELIFGKVRNINISHCKIKSLLEISGVEERLSFEDTVNMGRIEIDCEENEVLKCLENYYIPKKTWYQKLNIFKKPTEVEINSYKAIAKDLKMLKENYRNIGEYEWEDECYRAYMKYHTKSLKWFEKAGFIKKPFNRLFGLISGYGTKVLNILVTCIVIILLFAGVYKSAFNSANLPFLKSLYFSAITFLTIGYGDLSPTNGSFKYWQVASTGIEGFIGLVLMSLVTVTIVRKILR